MAGELELFEQIVRRAFQFTTAAPDAERTLHPFEERNVHDGLPKKVKALFDDGHYAEATFQAFKFIDKTVQKLSKSKESGFKLMMNALSDASPLVQLTPCSTVSEKDEQKVFNFFLLAAF